MRDINLRDLIIYTLELGASEAEIYISRKRVSEIFTEREKIKAEYRDIIDLGARIAVGRKITTLYISNLMESNIRDLLRYAVSAAKASDEDPYWNGLPEPGKPTHDKEYYDDRIREISIDSIIKRLDEERRYVSSLDDRVKPVKLEYRLIDLEVSLVNSNGIDISEKATGMTFSIEVKGRDGREVVTFGFKRSRMFIDSVDDTLEAVVSKCIDLFKAVELGERYHGVIALDPIASGAIFKFSLAKAILASTVQEGFSPFKGKLGEKMGSSKFTVVDDGCLDYGWNTSIYDDEGVSRRRTIVFEAGVLKSFLHNTYTARREGIESTGNAVRRGGSVGVGISNLCIKPSNKSRDELLSSYDRLIYITNMPLNVHTINYVTGQVNIVAQEAYLVVKGSIERVLKPVTVTGNIYDSLMKFDNASDFRDSGFDIYSPTIILGDFTIA